MIHRAILGSLERFVGILIEDTVGDFPVWLSPVQATVIPITSDQNEAARKFRAFLAGYDIRSELNEKSDTMGAKIRQAEMAKIPYMFIIGEREAADETVTIRRRKQKNQETVSWQQALEIIQAEINNKGGIVN